MENIELPQQAREAEQAFLANVLADPTLSAEFYPLLEPGYFYRQTNRFIWRAIEVCIEDGIEPTQLNVQARLSEHGVLDEVDSVYLDKLAADLPQRTAAQKHCETVRDFYRVREMNSTFLQAHRKLRDHEWGFEKARAYVYDTLQGLSDDGGGGYNISEVSEEAINTMDRLLESDENPFFETGVDVVDELIGGLHKSRFYLLASRPKRGKTSLALAMLAGLCQRHGFAADFFYTDGPRIDIGVALQAHLSRVPNEKIRMGEVDEDDYRAVMKAHGEFDSWNLEIHPNGSPNPDEIAAIARTRAELFENYIVVVDYIQKCNAGFRGQDAGRLNAEYASKTLSALRDTGAIVLGLAQFNRSAEGEGIPLYSQLKSSGQLEQDVNDLIVWERPKMTQEPDNDFDQKFFQRYGVLQHQLSKHAEAGGGRSVEVDAKLAINRFDRMDRQQIQSEAMKETETTDERRFE